MVSDSTGAESSLERPFAVDISRQAEILEKTTASLVSNALPNRGRLVGQIGGLAASSEAFARDHGVVRAEELFRSPVGSEDSASRLVSVVGGQVLVAGDVRRASERPVQANPPAPSLSGAVTRRTDGFTSARHAQRGEAWTDSGRMLPVAAWQRPGGLALRSELIASQLAGSPPWSSTLGASQWGRAPGLPSSLAQLFLSPQREEVQPRWAMGPQGLLFVAGPQPSNSAAQTVSPQTQRPRENSVRPQASPATNAARVEQPGLIPTLLDTLVQAQQRSVTVPGLTPAAGRSPSSRESFSAVGQDGTRSAERTPAATMPWQSLGGMGALAELFATGVAMGTGSAGSVAQALGVTSGHSLAPDWLRQLMSRQASPELSERFAGLLPSLVFPSVFSSSGGATPSPKETRRSAGILGGAVLPPSFKSSDSTPSAARHPMGSLLAGGLAATAESFARQHGIERATTNEERAAQRGFGGDAEATAEPFGRWLPVAGGMVFVPKEYAKAAQPSGRRQDAPRTAGQPAPSAPSAATMATFAQLGGMALRSELFSALLGPQARQVGVDRFPSLTGWENIAALLTSLPQQQDAAESSLPRWAWSGAGGLMFLGAPSNVRQSASERVQLDPAAPVHRGGRTAESFPTAAPGSVGRMAEVMADRSATPVRSAEHIVSPLMSLLSGPSLRMDSRQGVSDVERAYSQRLLTSFPRQQRATDSESAPTSLWPTATLQHVQRLEKVVSMLPTEWQPSMKVVAALRQSGVAQTPLWQELPKALNSLKPYETADDGEDPIAGLPQVAGAALRSPTLSMVGRTATPPTPVRSDAPKDEAAKQQAVEKAMREAVSSLIQSGGQAGASARLLEAIRSHASASPTRTDDRVNLGDLTLIALSMGENRIAASSPDHPKDRLEPNVANALRMKNFKHVEDDKNTYRKTVSEHAEQVVKYMKDQLEKQKLRGQ